MGSLSATDPRPGGTLQIEGIKGSVRGKLLLGKVSTVSTQNVKIQEWLQFPLNFFIS